MSIGVFDSGIGGLTVVSELLRVLPEERIVYFGDTARVPYGGKSTPTIRKFADQIVQFLLSKDVNLIVVACNTVSATSIDWLKAKYSLPIVGVIEPGVIRAVKTTQNQKIGVIGTRATIESKAYQVAIHNINPKIKVYSRSCPLLVPLAEEGWFTPFPYGTGFTTEWPDSRATLLEVIPLILSYYLLGLKKKGIDTLILGCTHYPLLRAEIQKVLGPEIKLVDSASSVALEVRNILQPQRPQSCLSITSFQPVKSKFYFSDIPRGFKQLSKRFLGFSIPYTRITL